MRLFLLYCALCCSTLSEGQQPLSAIPESPVITEYLLGLDQDLTLFLSDDQAPPDAYTYLRPLEGIRQEGTWLLVPFLPETFGIDQQSGHLVFEYLYSEKRQLNSKFTLPMIFLLEDFKACASLHKRIKAHFSVNSNN